MLDLDLLVEGGLLRFFHGTAPLLFADELVSRLNVMVSELVESRDAAAKRAEDEAKRAGDEAKRAEALEARVAELEAELARLRR